MKSIVGSIGDRLLEKFAPKAVAKADTSFETICYCGSNDFYYRKYCHVVGGRTSCSACYLSSPCLP